MSHIAFALRDEYAGTVTIDGEQRPAFLGGVIRAGDQDLNLLELVTEGDGTIVVDDRDPRVIAALDESPALKRVAVPAGAAPIVGGYEDETATALRAEAKRRGLEGLGNANKAELVSALEADDRGDAATEEG